MFSRDSRWKLSCPHCGDQDHIHLSQMRWHELPWLLLAMRMYRCYGCGQRFKAGMAKEAESSAPVHRSASRSDTTAACPNCRHEIGLLLSTDEMRLARSEGRYISCPACSATFVHHA